MYEASSSSSTVARSRLVAFQPTPQIVDLEPACSGKNTTRGDGVEATSFLGSSDVFLASSTFGSSARIGMQLSQGFDLGVVYVNHNLHVQCRRLSNLVGRKLF